jgi:hypothetical protein
MLPRRASIASSTQLETLFVLVQPTWSAFALRASARQPSLACQSAFALSRFGGQAALACQPKLA